jgi:hypothetical protein
MSILIASAFWLATAASGADAVTACRTAHGADPAAHIACLEAALRDAESPDAIETPTARTPAATTPTTNAPTATAPAAAQVPAAREKSTAPDSLGAEQLPNAQKPPGPAPATVQVTSVAYDLRGRGIFRLSNGQVWQETERTPESLRLEPDVQYVARIGRGKFGGYRMYVEGQRRMIKIKRVE